MQVIYLKACHYEDSHLLFYNTIAALGIAHLELSVFDEKGKLFFQGLLALDVVQLQEFSKLRTELGVFNGMFPLVFLL